MHKIILTILSFFAIQTCSAQSALFDIFESSSSKINKSESLVVITKPTDELTEQIVDSYTLQNSAKKYKSNTPNSTTASLEQMLKNQQQQTAELIAAAQEATKTANQASSAANNLASKIQLLILSQESTQQALQNKLNSIPK